MVIRARVVLPIREAPIENGAVVISGDRVARVGPWKTLSRAQGEVLDLGDSILLPGLVNAHCHLDYTDMAGAIPPQRSFTDWIKLMLAEKAGWNYTEFAASWLHGADMLLRTGTTTVADFEAVPELLPDVWSATPLRVISLIEMTGVKSRRDPGSIVREALERIDSMPPGRSRAGLAPHSPYSTVPELLRVSAEAALSRSIPISVHVGESSEEFEMFSRRRGVMFAWLRRNQRDMSDCGLGSPVEHLERSGILGRNLLAVHLNYVGRRDAALLARRKVNVVHCPRSHAYFKHRKFPWKTFMRAGVNVCFGTDSLATVYKKPRQSVALNMFDEMRAFKTAHPSASAKMIVRMATINGARAVGMPKLAGEIARGSFADLIAIPFNGNSNPYDAVLRHSGSVPFVMIDGRRAHYE